MFDSWDNGKIYVRPYDMDSQMGINNDGRDVVPTYIEIESAAENSDTPPAFSGEIQEISEKPIEISEALIEKTEENKIVISIEIPEEEYQAI
jgi:hypothetical protein